MLKFDVWPPEKGKIHVVTLAAEDGAQDFGLIEPKTGGYIEVDEKRYHQSFFYIGALLAANMTGYPTPAEVLDVAQSIDFEGWNLEGVSFRDEAHRQQVAADSELQDLWDSVIAGATCHIRSLSS